MRPPAPNRPSMRRRALLGTTALLILAAGAGAPSPARADFSEGTQAYQAGDYERAYNEWLPLARAGNAAAQRNIGQLYRLGLGVPKDLQVAVNWYRLAAEQGLARAQSNLAVMYLRGEGVEQSPETAAEWLLKAAEQGHAISQYNLALLYEQGYGVARDRRQAARWFSRAAEGGHDKAGERLAALLADAVVPAAGEAIGTPPEPARPIMTARAEDYLPARILNRHTREEVAPPPAASAEPARHDEPAPVQVAAASPREQAQATVDRLTEVLTAPPSPATMAGTPAAFMAVRPEPALAAPSQVARLPETAPEAEGLRKPAFLRSEPAQAPEPGEPIRAALGTPPRADAAAQPAPRPAPGSDALLPPDVPPFLREEAALSAAPRAISPAPVIRVPVAPFLREEAQGARADVRSPEPPPPPAAPVEPVAVAALSPPVSAAPGRPTQTAALVVPTPEPAEPKPVPDFLVREAMPVPASLELKPRFGPHSYLVPRHIPAELRLQQPVPATRRLVPAEPPASDVPAFLVREAQQDETSVPSSVRGDRERPVEMAALPPAATPLGGAGEPVPVPAIGPRIPVFYVRAASQPAPVPAFLQDEAEEAVPVPPFLEREAAAGGTGDTRLASLTLPGAAARATAAAETPVPGFLRDEARPATAAPLASGDPPIPAFLREEALTAALLLSPPPASTTESRISSYYRDRAVRVAALEGTGVAAAAPFLRRAESASASAPLKPAPRFLAEEARAAAVPVPDVLRREAERDAASRPVPGTGPRAPRPDEPPSDPGEEQVAALPATAGNDDVAAPALHHAETPGERRAVDAGVAAYLGRDYDKALGLWLPPANGGNADAQFFVAGLLLDGRGVARDLVAAHVWFARAAAQGHERAAEQLGLLRKIMTQAQYAEAESRYRAAR